MPLYLLFFLLPITRGWIFKDSSGQLSSLSMAPRFVAGEWTECSVSCGVGVQSRSVECVASHPFAATIRLPQHECKGAISPALFRPCSSTTTCAQREEAIREEEYHWRNGEWSPCSVSCMGGKQRAHLECVQVSTGRVVEWSKCDARRRPPERSRECNTQPCPARWTAKEWSECTADCTRSRIVRCERTNTNGGATTQVALPDSHCQGHKPNTTDTCEGCSWMIGEWTQCSVSCGRGVQKRTVQCQSTTGCSQPVPDRQRPCEAEECKERSDKKLTLDLGGYATIHQGTSIKVKCSRKDSDKKNMYWTKNGNKIQNNAHLKMSNNGNLRIAHARIEDSGLYECFEGNQLRGNVTIRFKFDENIPLKGGKLAKGKFKAGKWGECRQETCAFRGIQEREVNCFLMEGRSHRKVSSSICETLHVTKPPATRPCTRTECSRWKTSEWSPCTLSPCVRKWTSLQTRTVQCTSPEDVSLDESRCPAAKPASTTHCANSACRAEWRVGEWAPCSASCGTGGVQLRMLQCVWVGTSTPAGSVCEGIQRPRATRACSHTQPLPPCRPAPVRDLHCHDNSRFCDIIKLFHSCQSTQVRERCCGTCYQVDNKL